MIPRTPATPADVTDAFLTKIYEDLANSDLRWALGVPTLAQALTAGCWLGVQMQAAGAPEGAYAGFGRQAFGRDPWALACDVLERWVADGVNVLELDPETPETAPDMTAAAGAFSEEVAQACASMGDFAFDEREAPQPAVPPPGSVAELAIEVIAANWHETDGISPKYVMRSWDGTTAIGELGLIEFDRWSGALKGQFMAEQIRTLDACEVALIMESWMVAPEHRTSGLAPREHTQRQEVVAVLIVDAESTSGMSATIERDEAGGRVGQWMERGVAGPLVGIMRAAIGGQRRTVH